MNRSISQSRLVSNKLSALLGTTHKPEPTKSRKLVLSSHNTDAQITDTPYNKTTPNQITQPQNPNVNNPFPTIQLTNTVIHINKYRKATSNSKSKDSKNARKSRDSYKSVQPTITYSVQKQATKTLQQKKNSTVTVNSRCSQGYISGPLKAMKEEHRKRMLTLNQAYTKNNENQPPKQTDTYLGEFHVISKVLENLNSIQIPEKFLEDFDVALDVIKVQDMGLFTTVLNKVFQVFLRRDRIRVQTSQKEKQSLKAELKECIIKKNLSETKALLQSERLEKMLAELGSMRQQVKELTKKIHEEQKESSEPKNNKVDRCVSTDKSESAIFEYVCRLEKRLQRLQNREAEYLKMLSVLEQQEVNLSGLQKDEDAKTKTFSNFYSAEKRGKIAKVEVKDETEVFADDSNSQEQSFEYLDKTLVFDKFTPRHEFKASSKPAEQTKNKLKIKLNLLDQDEESYVQTV